MAIVVTKIQTLHCQPGDHEWTREPKRGRAPVHCPEHAPEPVEKTPKTLFCETGAHEYQQPPGKGQARRKNCSEHAPVRPVVVPRSERVVISKDDAEEILNGLQGVMDADKLARARARAQRLTEMMEPLLRKQAAREATGPRDVPVKVVEGSKTGGDRT